MEARPWENPLVRRSLRRIGLDLSPFYGTPDPLTELAIHHRTDKWGSHFYTLHYHRRFAPLRGKPVKLLEIGVGGYANPLAGGESLRMWRDYFPKGMIIGVDIHDKSALAGDRITIEKGDQSDPEFLARLVAVHGPFDIVIDDGSHMPDHVRASFLALFQYLRNGGWYVIEDLQTSYWRAFADSTRPGAQVTTIDFVRELIDHIHYAEFDVVGYVPSELDRSVVAVEVVRNLAFIQKGLNNEPSNMLGSHPHERVVDLQPRDLQ